MIHLDGLALFYERRLLKGGIGELVHLREGANLRSWCGEVAPSFHSRIVLRQVVHQLLLAGDDRIIASGAFARNS